MSRLEDLVRFYALLGDLAAQQGGGLLLARCHGRLSWPNRGVYFFFEPGEARTDSGHGPRVVRVGTHALTRTSRTTLWKRLAQHRGTTAGHGNHRGSIFRLLVGQALLAREGREVPTWGLASSRGAAAERVGRPTEALAAAEAPVEAAVSVHLGAMRLVVLNIDDEPGPDTLRGTVERNAIALLSNHARPPLDALSPTWLGSRSPRARVRRSGLWNQNHVEAAHAPEFLDVFARLVGEGGPAHAPAVLPPPLPPAPSSSSGDALFAGLRPEHVRAAATRIAREGVPARRSARSTVALVGGQEYPAKYLLGLAYEEATGEFLLPERYTGGAATAAVLARLGFDVRHGRRVVRGHHT